MPLSAFRKGQVQHVDQISHTQTGVDVLLIGVDEQLCFFQLRLVHQFLELLPGFWNPAGVTTVHNEDQALRLDEVVVPESPDLLLAPNVPHDESQVSVAQGL